MSRVSVVFFMLEKIPQLSTTICHSNSTVYRKGAEVIRMYETILGTDGFRKVCDTYPLQIMNFITLHILYFSANM